MHTFGRCRSNLWGIKTDHPHACRVKTEDYSAHPGVTERQTISADAYWIHI
jgi:hypothetical protein